MTYPTHVVVDTIDGYVFSNDGTGQMDFYKATQFARKRNAERKPESRTYMVFELKLIPAQYVVTDSRTSAKTAFHTEGEAAEFIGTLPEPETGRYILDGPPE